MARANPNSYKAQPLLAAQIENGRALLSVLSIMAFLACLTLLFARGAARLSTQWQTDLRNRSSV